MQNNNDDSTSVICRIMIDTISDGETRGEGGLEPWGNVLHKGLHCPVIYAIPLCARDCVRPWGVSADGDEFSNLVDLTDEQGEGRHRINKHINKQDNLWRGYVL